MKKLQAFWSDFQLPIIIFIGFLLLILGYVGFVKYGIENGEERTIWDNIYLTVGLMTMETGSVEGIVNWQLEVSRFLIPVVTAYTAILAFAAIFQQQAQLVRLWFIKRHIVIYGLGDIGSRLAEQYLLNGESVVIVNPEKSAEDENSLRSSGAIVMNGNLQATSVLFKARIHRAKTVFLVTEDDSNNAEAIIKVEEYLTEQSNHHMNCIVHISDAQLWRLLRDRELNHSVDSNMRLELFNTNNHGAALLLRQHPIDRNNPTMMVIGKDGFSETLIVQACLQWKDLFSENHEKLRIFVIEQKASKHINTILAKQPDITKVAELIPLETDVNSSLFLQGEIFYQNNQRIIPNQIVICLGDATLSFSTALILKEQFQNQPTNIIIQTNEDTGLAHLVKASDENTTSPSPIFVFPLLDKTCTPEILLRGTHEIIARELHETYLDSLPKSNLTHWETLPDSTKEVNRKQAERISRNLLAHGYRVLPLTNWFAADFKFNETEGQDEVEEMAKFEHILWCKGLEAEGWSQGSERSNKKKTHPDLVPWDKLPLTEMEKNKIFIRSIPRILARVGFEIQKY